MGTRLCGRGVRCECRDAFALASIEPKPRLTRTTLCVLGGRHSVHNRRRPSTRVHQRFPSAIRLKLFELSFAMDGAVLHRMVMMPMMSMPVFYMAPAPQHMNLMCILRQMFQKSQPYAKRQRSVVGELMRATMRYITTFLRHTKTLVRGVAWKRVWQYDLLNCPRSRLATWRRM